VPQRITPTQFLAFFIGSMIAGHVMFERSFTGQFFSVMEALFEAASKEPEDN
jgi:hypothetical protein